MPHLDPFRRLCRPQDVSKTSDGPKPTLIRRVTSRLNIAIPGRPSRTLPADPQPARRERGQPPSRTLSADPPTSFVSKQHREAALRERGLLPPCKDLSVQEREADERLGTTPSPVSATHGSSEAEQFKVSWLATHRSSSESSDAEHARLPTPESESKTDLLSVGRPSLCSSLPPLSISSYLEVLHEEPSEQAPITPPPPLSPVRLPIIVSSPIDDLSPIMVESPVSWTFSSHCPGSTVESQSQSDHPPPVPEKDSRLLASRRRTSDSGHRPRKTVGTSLTRLGTHSLTNLRRSMTEGFGRASTSTLSSSDHASSIAHRAAVSPTIHSLGSILKETRAIEDAESRRLSELAFLD